MLSFLPKILTDIMHELRTMFQERRKSLGSLKRFESSGQIALESLLKLALVLECLGDFSNLCEESIVMPKNMNEILEDKLI